MVYEYLLISVLVASGYWGWYFVRKRPNQMATFGLMHLGAAALAGLGLLGRKYEAGVLGIAGAIGLGAGVCLLIVGPLVRGLARRFAAMERFGAAARLLDVAEVLAPGSGVAEEKAVLGAMKEIRDGRVEQTVDALVAAKDRAPADARVAIDERIAMLYLAAHRWSDAIDHAEAHLFGAISPASSGDDGAPAPSQASLRDALGIAPPVWVELFGAYGHTGDLDQAARMLARLEDVCTGREDAALWVHRGRLIFLALAGRATAVQQLVQPPHARHMTAAARNYWVAVAHEHGGNRAAASVAYEKARARSRGHQTELIDRALARLAQADATQLSPMASEVVARVEAAPLPPPPRLPRPRRPWAAWSLTASLGIVALVVWQAIGPSSDPGVLVRDGGMVRVLVQSGEWWRLVSCIFVHVGVVHLVVNAIGLYFLARICDELFGSARTIAIFGLAGLTGAVASHLWSPAGVSAGASGAIFGLLGALFVELTLHRDRYRAAWKRGLWGGVVVITLAQVGVGFAYPIIDQWAHGGGLLGGAIAGALLSPSAWPRATRFAGRAIAIAFASLVVAAAVLVTRTSITDSLERAPLVRHVIGDVALTAPADWTLEGGGLRFSEQLVVVRASRDAPAPELPAALEAFWRTVTDQASKRDFERVEAAPDRTIALPEGWEGRELVGSFDDALGARQRYRVIACARVVGGSLVYIEIYTPETMAREAPGFFARLIASAGPA